MLERFADRDKNERIVTADIHRARIPIYISVSFFVLGRLASYLWSLGAKKSARNSRISRISRRCKCMEKISIER